MLGLPIPCLVFAFYVLVLLILHHSGLRLSAKFIIMIQPIIIWPKKTHFNFFFLMFNKKLQISISEQFVTLFNWISTAYRLIYFVFVRTQIVSSSLWGFYGPAKGFHFKIGVSKVLMKKSGFNSTSRNSFELLPGSLWDPVIWVCWVASE